MPTLYSIRDWDKHFENAQSRRVGAMSWVAIPNKHDGKSYRRLMRRPNGPALYGVWILLVQIASKCPTRGVLLDADGPLTIEDFEMKTDCPAELFAEALEVLTSPDIAWILGARSENKQLHGTEDKTDKTKASDVLSLDALRNLDWEEVCRICREVNKAIPCTKPQDRSLLLKAAALSLSALSQDWLVDSVEAVRIAYAKTPPPNKPRAAYLHGVLASKCKERGQHFNTLLKQVTVPDSLLKPPAKTREHKPERGELKPIAELLKG